MRPTRGRCVRRRSLRGTNPPKKRRVEPHAFAAQVLVSLLRTTRELSSPPPTEEVETEFSSPCAHFARILPTRSRNGIVTLQLGGPPISGFLSGPLPKPGWCIPS